MRDIKKMLELRARKHSQRFIARSLHVSRNTVKSVFEIADIKGLYWSQAQNMEEDQIQEYLFGSNDLDLVYQMPDFEYIHKELLKEDVTLKNLWDEYVDQCRSSSKPAYQLSNFYRLYAEYVKKNNLTMHIHRKPGHQMMVDWDGKTAEITDRYTGEIIKAYLFVAVLPFSMYAYIQACPSMDSNQWIDCHINAFHYFGGTARLLVPDNLKTGVVSHKKYEDPVLNRSYQEMADHYDIAVLPARVRKPKDKGAVEGTVRNITTAILGHLRKRKFFSFEELNKAILIELEKFNKNPFQKREGSRKSVFEEEEKAFLRPLPEHDFELSQWKKATVQMNYHVAVDKMNYSVPYEYVGKKVEVKITKSKIDIYYKGTLICTHKRMYGRKNQYSTVIEHMPKDHQMYTWNGDRFKRWANNIGPSTYQMIESLLSQYKVEEQSYKGCLSLLKLSEKYSEARLENACKLALSNITKPSYKNIRLILQSGQDLKEEEKQKNREEDYKYAYVRGKEYYGKNNQ
ncbi:IS21 family transposase [Faecalicoccus pleomorphus]|uniref:IS21 family transposase n=1 Tax=Faecalicoccus pleomorphus TaxID=1323 RepID=UPI0039F54465